jgi:UDP-3-O-[3-hydroxymyristoyl] glucosamine N-acyltransferase
MHKTLGEIAEYLGCELIGDKGKVISALAPIETAKSGEITFVSNPKYLQYAIKSKASAFIVQEGMEEGLEGRNLIISQNSYYSFARLLTLYHWKEKKFLGIDKGAFVAENTAISEYVSIYPNVYVDEGVVIKENVKIYPGCFIGKNVTIGSDTVLYPNVVVREESVIGSHVIIHAGTVIGNDGFGYAFNDGRYFKIPQVGRVVIKDNVEIGANVTIDRAAMGETVIGEGTKIDNLVMVAHNVKIGKNCILTAQVGISGSVDIGDYATFGGQAGTAGHLKVGDRVTAAARSVITKDIKDGETVAGFPAIDIKKWRKTIVLSNNLSDMKEKIKELEKRLSKLEGGA